MRTRYRNFYCDGCRSTQQHRRIKVDDAMKQDHYRCQRCDERTKEVSWFADNAPQPDLPTLPSPQNSDDRLLFDPWK